MTMKNTYGKPGQAEVIYNNSNGAYTLTFINCSLISLQDTFNTKGYCWMYNCLVEGDCDFIWGSPKTCLFEKCEIRAAGDGYIVQARCMDSKDKGFVFLDCNLTKADEVKAGTMYLARSSGSADYYDNVTYINCRMSDAIAPSGWYGKPVPNPATSSASSGWKEFRSTDSEGGELSVSSRLQASYQLTEAEYSAGFKDRETIFSDSEVGTSWLVL
jgi:pectin methylesterase-like acyl-CoA thioesterase